jgi:amino acid adenylation domain-containing protein
VHRVPLDLGTARLDLTLSLFADADGLTGEIEYNTDLFDGDTIARMAGHFLTLLEGAVSDPDRRIHALPLLTPVERRLLDEWNATDADYPRDCCVHQLFEAQAKRSPHAVALEFDGRRLTYRELDARANQLAGYLQARGLGPEVLVGICLERSLEMVVGLLGVLKAGGAYVPLDPAYPKERLAFILEETRAPLLLTHERLLGGLPEHGARVICLDRDWDEISREPDESPAARVTAENLAYVIYTSGSTGMPKGVQIAHRSVTNFLTAMSRTPGLTGEDTLLAVTTVSFDIAGLELYLPLSVGARVVVVDRAVAADGVRLAEALAASGATAMQATPATWRLLLDAGWPGDRRLTVLCGGEALPRELADQLLTRCGSLWNLYGPTETTIWSTVHRVEPGEGPVPIGRPIANTQVYVLDPHGQSVPVGVPGELYIGGAGVARGYLNRPEQTAERFVAGRFSADGAALLYRTGDWVRYRPDGTLVYLWRLDQQVKVRGFRIELAEIEVALASHPAVAEAVAGVREYGPADVRLIAYFVPAPGSGEPTGTELRALLRARLPEYMVPSVFVTLPAVPRTPNGKVDRKALPEPDLLRAERSRDPEPPRTEAEMALAEIWRAALGVAGVGRQDNFFDLGGHSLLSMQVIFQVEERLGVRLAPRDIALNTLGQLGALCERSAARPPAGPSGLGRRLRDLVTATRRGER